MYTSMYNECEEWVQREIGRFSFFSSNKLFQRAVCHIHSMEIHLMRVVHAYLRTKCKNVAMADMATATKQRP